MISLRAATPADALTADALAPLAGEPLLAWLRGRRWFAGKGEPARDVRIDRVVPLPWEGGPFAIARLRVEGANGVRTYQLPLALATEGQAPIASVEVAEGARLALVDATESPAFLRHLVAAIARGGDVAGPGGTWRAEAIGERPLVVPDSMPVRLAGAEQSNTSILVGDVAIVKLFRTLEAGEHPDLEVTRHLTAAVGFPHVPVVLGAAWLDAGDGSAVAAVMQELMPGARDAWQWTLEAARPYFTAARSAEPRNTYVTEARRLGAVTRELHEALADDDAPEAFAPEPASAEDVEQWAAGASRWATEALSLLERQLAAGAYVREREAEAQILVRRRDQYLAWIDSHADQVADDPGFRIRIHGDYHLGQVLRTASDAFVIIDFEGEPARPLAERREKASPLRDVAGMLRSFAYAAATLANESKMDVATRELRSARWERDVRAAFLEGYLGAADGEEGGILPEERAHVTALLALFEAEKVFYELAYELNNRPEWTWIPVRGISRLLVGR